MRIISQDRTSDIPYDRVILCIWKCSHEKYHICASFGSDEKDDFHIGEYESKERCLEIMQEIREAVAGKIIAKSILPEDEIIEMEKQLRRDPVKHIVISESDVRTLGENYFYMPEE